MSSLQRYRRSGGFNQLVSLIETFGPQKKEKFLEMIEAESPAWGKALREKMITMERVFTWPDEIISEIFKHLPPKSFAYALLGLQEDQRDRIQKTLSQAEQRRMSDVLSESQPKPEEISSTLVKVVEMARKMIQERDLNPERFDEKLMIPEDYEAKLEVPAAHESTRHIMTPDSEPVPPAASVVSAAATPSSAHAGGVSSDVAQLQVKLAMVVKENKTLKDEVKVLREKLEQIRRIA